MLDEPAAGMNPNETHEIAELIGRLRDELSLSILVIGENVRLREELDWLKHTARALNPA